MAAAKTIFSLPNEVLLNILSAFETPFLLKEVSRTCRHFLSLVLRTVHNRLQIASMTPHHVLYLQCHPPHSQEAGVEVFCDLIGTPGLDDLMRDVHDEATHLGQSKRVRALYSRFRPRYRNTKSLSRPTQRHPAGDVPGSRTYPVPTAETSTGSQMSLEEATVSQTITIDAHDLCSQMLTIANLVRQENTRGFLLNYQEVSSGSVRVWRDWLARHCERKTWSDGEPIEVLHDLTSASPPLQNQAHAEVANLNAPLKDDSILWLNTGDDSLGIKFRVKERKWRNSSIIPLVNDVEAAVSYEVIYEEILIRTTHLLLKTEALQRQMDNRTGKMIMFGSFYDTNLREIETGGARIMY